MAKRSKTEVFLTREAVTALAGKLVLGLRQDDRLICERIESEGAMYLLDVLVPDHLLDGFEAVHR